MKTSFLLMILIFSFNSVLYSQTTKSVHTFPEDYVGQTITFKNIRYWPILKEKNGYYSIQIDISKSLYDEREWGFKTFSTIIGVVQKEISKQMINNDIGGYNMFYFGTVKGKVVKSDEVFGSDYLFIITKIINHPPNEPETIINKFEKK